MLIDKLKTAKAEKSTLELTQSEVNYVLDCVAFRQQFEFKPENSSYLEGILKRTAETMEAWRKYISSKGEK